MENIGNDGDNQNDELVTCRGEHHATKTAEGVTENEDTSDTDIHLYSADAPESRKLLEAEDSISSGEQRISSFEAADGSKDVFGGQGPSPEKGCRACSTPLRLRRLPASFWQEPNVPKGFGGKHLPGKGYFGSCHPLYPHFYQKDHHLPYNDYDFLRKYRDPASGSSFPAPVSQSGSLFPSSKFCDPAELLYLDPPSNTWPPPVAHRFLPMPSIHLGAGANDLPFSSSCNNFSATAALYSHVMRRAVSDNYRHGNFSDVMTDRLTTSSAPDDLWRLVPCRPLSDVFSKRFHPYL